MIQFGRSVRLSSKFVVIPTSVDEECANTSTTTWIIPRVWFGSFRRRAKYETKGRRRAVEIR